MTQGFTPIPATSAVGIELGMELKPYLMPWQLLARGSVQFPSTAHAVDMISVVHLKILSC